MYNNAIIEQDIQPLRVDIKHASFKNFKDNLTFN